MGKKWAKKYIFFLLGIYSDSARNDSEWLGMDKNLSLNFFTWNEGGIWSDSYLFGRIRSDSYHSARIRSECVGEGKVLPIAIIQQCRHQAIFFQLSPLSHCIAYRMTVPVIPVNVPSMAQF